MSTSSIFSRETLPKDAFASLVVFLVALPLCMGIAVASGMPPAAGIITGMIGGIIVGSLSGSPFQVSGPAAGMTVIVYELVNTHGMAALGPIVLLAGLIQLVSGFLGLGRWFRAISPAVIDGMLAGIGALIILGQLHVMVDDLPRKSGIANLMAVPEAFWKGVVPGLGTSHHIAALVGLGTIMVIALWSKMPQRFLVVPPALMGVAFASLISAVMDLPIRFVELPDHFAGALKLPTWELLMGMSQPALLIAAVTIAIVASAETMLSAAAVDKLHNGVRTQYDKELRAQGVGNAICGLFGALPMTGVIVRSSANVHAGAKTRLSAILHGVWLLALVLAAPWLLERIPLTALAALLVYTGFKLLSPQALRGLAKHGKSEVVIYFITMLGVITTNLLEGIVIGFICALLKQHWVLSHLDAEIEKHEAGEVQMKLTGAGTFLAVPNLMAVLGKVPTGTSLTIDMTGLQHVDHAFLEAIAEWERSHKATGGGLELDWESLWAIYDSGRPSRTGRGGKVRGAPGPLVTS